MIMSEIDQSNIDIVVAGFEAGKTDNDILSELFSNGIEFSDVRKVFNEVVKEKGLRLTSKERKIKVDELLEGWVPEGVGDLLGKVAMVQDELKVATTRATNAVKAWAKENEVTLPKPPKKVREVKQGFGGFMERILAHALENRGIDHAGLKEFCKDNDINTNYAKSALNAITFARKWAGEGDSE